MCAIQSILVSIIAFCFVFFFSSSYRYNKIADSRMLEFSEALMSGTIVDHCMLYYTNFSPVTPLPVWLRFASSELFIFIFKFTVYCILSFLLCQNKSKEVIRLPTPVLTLPHIHLPLFKILHLQMTIYFERLQISVNYNLLCWTKIKQLVMN